MLNKGFFRMYITVAEYARQKNTTTKQVYDLIHRGELPYKKVKDKLHIFINEDAGDNVEDQQASINNLFESE